MLKQKIEEIIKNETIKSQIKSHLPLQERATNLYPSQEGHIKQLAQSLTSALELDEGKVKDLVKYPPLIRPIVDGILQPLKIPEWQVENPKALIKALCSKYKEGELNK